MAAYSHSKVSTFENCPYQYKLHYIDKIEVDIPTTIEPFMGDIVHQFPMQWTISFEIYIKNANMFKYAICFYKAWLRRVIK